MSLKKNRQHARVGDNRDKDGKMRECDYFGGADNQRAELAELSEYGNQLRIERDIAVDTLQIKLQNFVQTSNNCNLLLDSEKHTKRERVVISRKRTNTIK